jgi:hypothetical protein
MHYVDEPDEVDAVVVEAVITFVVRGLTEAVEVFRPWRLVRHIDKHGAYATEGETFQRAASQRIGREI